VWGVCQCLRSGVIDHRRKTEIRELGEQTASSEPGQVLLIAPANSQAIDPDSFASGNQFCQTLQQWPLLHRQTQQPTPELPLACHLAQGSKPVVLMLCQKRLLTLEQPLATWILWGELGALQLQTNELAPIRLAVFFEPVCEDQPDAVVIGVVFDRVQKSSFEAHRWAPCCLSDDVATCAGPPPRWLATKNLPGCCMRCVRHRRPTPVSAAPPVSPCTRSRSAPTTVARSHRSPGSPPSHARERPRWRPGGRRVPCRSPALPPVSACSRSPSPACR